MVSPRAGSPATDAVSRAISAVAHRFRWVVMVPGLILRGAGIPRVECCRVMGLLLLGRGGPPRCAGWAPAGRSRGLGTRNRLTPWGPAPGFGGHPVASRQTRSVAVVPIHQELVCRGPLGGGG